MRRFATGCAAGWAPTGLWAGGWPDPVLFAMFGIGALLTRGAGCTFNDILDRKLDAAVERTRSRPLPAGQLYLRKNTLAQGLGRLPRGHLAQQTRKIAVFFPVGPGFGGFMQQSIKLSSLTVAQLIVELGLDQVHVFMLVHLPTRPLALILSFMICRAVYSLDFTVRSAICRISPISW